MYHTGEDLQQGHGNVDDDCSDDSDDDRSTCLQEMLGGIDFQAEWKEEMDGYYPSIGDAAAVATSTSTTTTTTTAKSQSKITPGLVDPALFQRRKRPILLSTTSTSMAATAAAASRANNILPNTTTTIHESSIITSPADDDLIFQYAFTCLGYSTSNHHQMERPPLHVFDFGEDSKGSSSSSSSRNNHTNKGKGLIATQFIPKGRVIYTERAAVATQMPKRHNSSTAAVTVNDRKPPSPSVGRTLACQTCFRSMESWTKLLPQHRQQNNTNKETSQFPFPELWPVLPLEFLLGDENQDQNDHSTTIHADRYGRIQCPDCQALFCSQLCYQEKLNKIGSCCLETRLQIHLPTLMFNRSDDDEDDNEEDTNEQTAVLQAPVILAAVLFLHVAQYYRTHHQSLEGHWYSCACGTAEDLQLLELGQQFMDEQTHQVCYTLAPLYQYMTEKLLNLDDNEKETLSLDLLHCLASKCARNGVSLCTQSPFKPYYSGLLRKTNYGGRESEAHSRHIQQLVAALGKNSLYRGMDRDIEALVAPEISGFFPLTAHCNHSCQPNALIQSQEFADAHIDIVAIEDIVPGQEVCISYIGRTSNKFQRQKELRGRYLFHCACERCLNEVV